MNLAIATITGSKLVPITGREINESKEFGLAVEYLRGKKY